jgi:phosphoribosyl-ATP pyrophosphohydrolase
MEQEYTINDFIDKSVAEAPDLSYLHSEFDDGYSDLNGAITDEAIEVGTQQLLQIQRTGEEIISDVNRQIQDRTDQQEQEKSETDESDSDGTDSATS